MTRRIACRKACWMFSSAHPQRFSTTQFAQESRLMLPIIQEGENLASGRCHLPDLRMASR